MSPVAGISLLSAHAVGEGWNLMTDRLRSDCKRGPCILSDYHMDGCVFWIQSFVKQPRRHFDRTRPF